MPKVIVIDNQKTILSSDCRVFKSERLIKDTRHLNDVDVFLYKVSEGIIYHIKELLKEGTGFKIETEDKEHSFFFIIAIDNQNKANIEFYKYIYINDIVKKNDLSLSFYLRAKSFKLNLQAITMKPNNGDFDKLYRLSYAGSINFPLLNETQQKIVTTEDQNMLVQGVAGSGKTNICIEKIIYSACRGYKGKVLYTTFSRGLLTDTKEKVKKYRNSLERFIKDYEIGNILFLDSNRKKAIENRLGIYFSVDDDDQIINKIHSIIGFLDNNVDYCMIIDFYNKFIGEADAYADENYFLKVYVKDIKNHQLSSKLEKLQNLSYEVIYKEIYGVIYGCFDLQNKKDMLSLDEYTEKRGANFSKYECEIIYSLAKDYGQYLIKNGFTNDNIISKRLLELDEPVARYSLAIIDEVQDMTEVNLCFFKSICLKMFCVGDALQMINPSYFSFSYLKRLLYEKDIVTVAELKSNYRNTKKIAEIINKLGLINTKQFGTHSFVLNGVSVDSGVPTSTVYVRGDGLIDSLSRQKFTNYTIIVPTNEEKEFLRAFLTKQEILTVAEIKGLERDCVVLYNILSDSYDKWKTLERMAINRKEADENSVYRYYFNLFYVAISRAKTHIYVTEDKDIPQFKEFFKSNFEFKSVNEAVNDLLSTSNKLELEQDEILERIAEFIKLSQYDNARFNADKVINDKERKEQLALIDINEQLIRHGKHREAGVRFWELSMLNEARKQFELSNDKALIDLLEASLKNDSHGLDVGVVSLLPEVENNDIVKRLIFETLNKDLKNLKNAAKMLSDGFKRLKEKKHG